MQFIVAIDTIETIAKTKKKLKKKRKNIKMKKKNLVENIEHFV